MVMDRVILVISVVLIVVAVYTDIRWRLIKNSITLPAIVIGLLLNILGSGWQGLLHSLIGFWVGAGLMMIPFLFGQMGGGDIKLMAALGTLLGGHSILNIFFYTTIAGGVLAVIVIIARGELASTLKRIWQLLKSILIARAPAAGLAQFDKSTKIPYGLAIGAGTFCFLLAGKVI